MTSRGLRAVDDDLLGASMEQIIAKRARQRADFVRLWADIDALLDERLECMASLDDCDSEVRA